MTIHKTPKVVRHKLIESDDVSVQTDHAFSKYVPIIYTDDVEPTYTVYLTKPIEVAHHYDELVYLLTYTVTADDKVNFIITTPGGYINTAMYIIDAMSKSLADITGILSGCVASAGTVIAMACDNLEVHTFSSMMIHNYKGGYGGAGHEIERDFNFTHPHIQRFMREFYDGFLTEEEMVNVFKGQDLYLDADSIISRWANVVALRESYTLEYTKAEITANIPVIQEELALVGYTAVPIAQPEKSESTSSKRKLKDIVTK